MRRLLVLALLCAGCAPVKFGPIVQAKELAQHIELFEAIYKTQTNYSVTIGELPDNMAGVCRVWTDGRREVVLDAAYYNANANNANVIEQLVFHELGHCTFDFAHRSELLSNGYPKSIMYPYAFGHLSYYNTYRTYYFAELIGTNQNFDAPMWEYKAQNEPDCVQHMD